MKYTIICGITESMGQGNHDIWVIKTNETGQKMWDKTFGYSENEDAYNIQVTTHNDYIIGGTTSSKGNGSYDALLLGLTSTGEANIEKYFGGNKGEIFYSVHETSDGGFICCGLTESYNPGKTNIFLVKTNKYGALE